MNASKSKHFQYPEQKGAYKVKVKNKSRWQEFNRAAFDISVGNSNQEGAKLLAAIEWAKPRFEKVVIHCNDTLQRFNMMFEEKLTAEEAEEKSRQAGDAWLARNAKALEGCEVERWDLWRANPKFEETLQKVNHLYQDNMQFRKDINDLINDLWCRRYDDSDTQRRTEFNTLSREYLLEETAIFALMNEEKSQLHVYPGTFMKVFDSFKGTNIIPGLGNLEYLHIDFSRNKSYDASMVKSDKKPANSNAFDMFRIK